MMKLSRRIQDLVRAGLTSPLQLSRLGKTGSPARQEAQLERIRKSLVQAAAREKLLQDDLRLAEAEGRERDALRLRRELADLARSADELQAALDLIEARIEMQAQNKAEAGLPASSRVASLAEEPESSEAPLAEEGDQDELAARKARLAKPGQ
jgi:hypothetical protein